MELRLLDYVPDNLRKNIHFIVLGALAFGIGGSVSGYNYFEPPMQLSGFIVAFIFSGIFWGVCLGLMHNVRKKIPMLILSGFLGSLICVVITSIWFTFLSLPIFFMMLYIFTPLCLILGIYNLMKSDFVICVICCCLALIGRLDLIFSVIGIQIRGGLLMVVFLFILIGLIMGVSYGVMLNKTREMMYFSMIGFALGSMWLLFTIQCELPDDILGKTAINFLIGATIGLFLSAGLFYNSSKCKKTIKIDSVGDDS